MGYDLYLSYSGRKSYDTCPKKYEYTYILRDKERGDTRGTFLGSIIGKVFEWFYTRKAWATPDPFVTCLSYINEATQQVFKKEDFNPSLDPAFVTMLQADLNRYIPEGIEVIRKQGLLSPQSRAESDLTIIYSNPKYDLSLKLGGRSDFVHGNNENDIWLMDGKASKHREKFVDAGQLIWYANLHYLKYHVAPTRLGFIFWCFPEDPIKWISYNNNDMRASLDHTFEVAKKIQLKQFEAKPSHECNFCNFKNKCEEGSKQILKRKVEAGDRIDSSIFDIERA
jgi:PD-(D/E)XK nuclease superfamily